MTPQIRTVVLLALAYTSANSHSADFPIVGAGTGKCTEWTFYRSSDKKSGVELGAMTGSILGWVQGYMTGANAVSSYLRKKPSAQLPGGNTVTGMLDDDCKATPQQTIAEAAVLILSRYARE